MNVEILAIIETNDTKFDIKLSVYNSSGHLFNFYYIRAPLCTAYPAYVLLRAWANPSTIYL